MLQPIKHLLATRRIVLASGSPRRQELVKNMGIEAELCPSLFEENLNPKDFPSIEEFVEETARQKVLEVYDRTAKDGDDRELLVIGADTVVTLDGEVYGKPKTNEKAFETLKKLMGRKNTVYTGVVIKLGDSQVVTFTETADVYFGQITDEQIQAYVNTGEPLDKAGGYGIQGVGGTMIERINGDYFTVMGFPLYRISTELCKMFGYPPSTGC